MLHILYNKLYEGANSVMVDVTHSPLTLEHDAVTEQSPQASGNNITMSYLEYSTTLVSHWSQALTSVV